MNIILYFQIGSAGLALLLAVGQALRPNKDRGRVIFAALLICLAVWCTYGAFFYYGELLNNYPSFYLLHMPFTYGIGPLAYLYFSFLIGGNLDVNSKSLLHLIPSVLVLFWLPPIFLSSPEYKICLNAGVENILTPGDACASGASPLYLLYERLTLWWIVGNKISVLLYMLGLSRVVVPLLRHETNGIPRIRILTILLAGYSFFICVLSLIGSFFKSPELVRFSIALVASWIVLVYFAGQRFPEYLADAHLKEAPINNSVQGLIKAEIERTVNDLKELMEEERVFLGEDLKLNNLALMLDIRPWQLSEILNTRFKKNFNQYINSYRIKEARKILTDEPDKNILGVAFDVGFNNKNTFNRVFRDDTGMTPSEFRKQARKIL